MTQVVECILQETFTYSVFHFKEFVSVSMESLNMAAKLTHWNWLLTLTYYTLYKVR